MYYFYLYMFNFYIKSYSFWIMSICIISICVLEPSFSLDINYFYLVHENSKGFKGTDCNCVPFPSSFDLNKKIQDRGMIFFYIMRQRWCCLYQLPQTTWLSMCQCILKFGSCVQQVSGGVQMHVHQFCYVQIGYFHYGCMQFGLLFFEYIFLRHKPTEKGFFCNGCLFCKWGHSLRKFWLSYHLLRSGYFMPSTSMHSTFVFILSLFQE